MRMTPCDRSRPDPVRGRDVTLRVRVGLCVARGVSVVPASVVLPLARAAAMGRGTPVGGRRGRGVSRELLVGRDSLGIFGKRCFRHLAATQYRRTFTP